MLYSKNNYNLFYIENIFAIDNYCAKVLEVACQKKVKSKLNWVNPAVIGKFQKFFQRKSAPSEDVLVCQVFIP